MSRRHRTNWIKRLFQATSSQPAPSREVSFQTLEDRTVPAVLDWVGDVAGNANWNAKVGSNTNWSGDVLPANGDTLRFLNSTATGNFTSNNNISNLSLAKIEITTGGIGSTDFVLNGNTVNLGSGGVIVTSQKFGSAAVNLTVTLSANSVIANDGQGSFSIGGGINLNDKTLTMDGTGGTNYTSTSIIAGNGAIVKQGTGTAIIDSIGNSYTGTTTVNSGTLDVRDGTGLGASVSGSSTIMNGGILSLGDGGDTFNETFVASGGVIQSTAGNNSLQGLLGFLTGDATIRNQNSGTTLTVNLSFATNGHVLAFDTQGATATIDYTGTISGAGSVEKLGPGTLRFTGGSSNIHTSTFVKDGKVIANRTSGQGVLPGTTIVGDGGGTPGSAILELIGGTPFPDAAVLFVNRDGVVNMAAEFTETITDLTLIRLGSITGTNTSLLSVSGILSIKGGSVADTHTLSGNASGLSINYSSVDGQAITTRVGLSGATKTISYSGLSDNDLFNASTFVATDVSLVYAGDLGDDTLIGSSGIEVMTGGDGNDRMEGRGGNDSLNGNLGNDTILCGDGNDFVDAGAGNDVVFGGNGKDFLGGIEGNDELRGDAGDDTIIGNIGNDTIEGSFGLDSIDGGADIDTIVAVTDGNLTVNASKLDLFGAANDDSLAGVEGAVLITGASNELIIANEFLGPIFVDSGLGNDFIIASHFSDLIFAGAGDDTVLGLPGNDSIEGGAGKDFIDGYTGDDTIRSGNDADKVFGFFGNDVIFLDGGDNANDASDGGDGNDLVFGGGGNDTLMGGNGNDTLQGEAGNDTLQGDAGNDSLLGGDNDDRLLGNAGDDTLDGGNGTDLAGDPLGTNVLLNIP